MGSESLRLALAIFVTLLVPGCGGGGDTSSSDGAGGHGSTHAAATQASSTTGLMATTSTGSGGGGDAFVYANGPDTLYAVDALSYEVTNRGKFDCVEVGPDDEFNSGAGMLDLAVDAAGELYGFGATTPTGDRALVTIDPMTAHCSIIATYPNGGAMLAGLSFLPASLAGTSGETLVGFDYSGTYYRVDRTDGTLEVMSATSPIGAKSPDLVAIEHDGVYVFDGSGALVEIDGATGETVRTVGGSCLDCGWGMGYWGGRAYGFSIDGSVHIVDVHTGETTPVTLTGDAVEFGFRGAGVTTQAPIVAPH